MSKSAGTPVDAEQLADRATIEDLLHAHCRGLDRLDVSLLQQCYWPDATVDYGSYCGPAHNFAGLVVGALEQAYELTRHCLSNVQIAVQGSTARVESYVNAGHLLRGGTEEMRFDGRYLDTLEKRDGQWKLISRIVVMDWSSTRTIEDERDSEAFADMKKGRASDQDPLHAFLKGDD